MEQFYFTLNGYEKFKEKINNIKNKLNRLQKQLGKVALTGGDLWHDNFSFEQLEIQIRQLNDQLIVHNRILNKAKIVFPPDSPEIITIGCKVYVEVNGKKEAWVISGYGESDPARGIKSYDTKIGALLVGAKKNDTKNIVINKKNLEIKVLDIISLKEV